MVKRKTTQIVTLTLLLLLAVALLATDNRTTATTTTTKDKLYGKRIVGIDLGARYARVAFYQNDTRSVHVIPNDKGARATPTYVTWDAGTGEVVVGEDARRQAQLNPHTTVFDFKRLLGHSFDSRHVQTAIHQLPYKIIDRDNMPFIQVTVKNEIHEFSLEEITAMVLAKLKQFAETDLGDEVSHAVVTVPAYFNDAARQTVQDAGVRAGVTVERIINEPMAGVIAQGIDKQSSAEKIVLVLDAGGGSFDVTLLSVDGGVFEVLAESKDVTGVGGDAFTQRILDHSINHWKMAGNVDGLTDPHVRERLRREAERVKKELSTQTEAVVVLELGDPPHSHVLTKPLSRVEFETVTKDLVEPISDAIDKVLSDGYVKRSEVDNVELYGGSARIPHVRQLVLENFNGKTPLDGVDIEEAVVHGAAVQAGILSREFDGLTKDMFFTPLTYYSLGVEVAGGVMHRIMPRYSIIPTRKQQAFTTLHTNQTDATIRVFEGERIFTRYNQLIGELRLSGLAGSPHIDVVFDLDANYEVLTVSAHDDKSGVAESLRIQVNETALAFDDSWSLERSTLWWDVWEANLKQAEDALEVESKRKTRIVQWVNNDRSIDPASDFRDVQLELSAISDAIVALPIEQAPTHNEL